MGTRRPSGSTTATDWASGRSARMVTPSAPGWAPSTECGSWCTPATMASMVSRLTGSAWLMAFMAQAAAM